MEFVLNEYKKQLTDDEILSDLKKVAQDLNVDYLSISVYKKHGRYSQTAIQKHFGTWKQACSIAGLRTERYPSELKLVSDEDYYKDLRRVAELIESDTVPYDAYIKYGKYSSGHIFARFKKWDIALRNAGLQGTGFSKDKITEQQCFDEIERIWILLGRQPTSTDIIKNGVSNYSIDTFKRRFGGWRKALEAFVQYINTVDKAEEVTEEDDDNNSNLDKANQIADRSEINPELICNLPKHRTPRSVNTRLRFIVLQRDNFKCCACGASPAKDPAVVLHVDHIKPWSKGGETVIDNLQTLCSKCNLGKSDLE